MRERLNGKAVDVEKLNTEQEMDKEEEVSCVPMPCKIVEQVQEQILLKEITQDWQG